MLRCILSTIVSSNGSYSQTSFIFHHAHVLHKLGQHFRLALDVKVHFDISDVRKCLLLPIESMFIGPHLKVTVYLSPNGLTCSLSLFLGKGIFCILRWAHASHSLLTLQFEQFMPSTSLSLINPSIWVLFEWPTLQCHCSSDGDVALVMCASSSVFIT